MRIGDAAAARAVLESVEDTGEVLEVRAAASFVLLDFPRAFEEGKTSSITRRHTRDQVGPQGIEP